MAAVPLDLIDADGIDAREIAMGKVPFDRVFYGAKHVVPGRIARIGRLIPREPLGQAGQEPAARDREMLLAPAPWCR